MGNGPIMTKLARLLRPTQTREHYAALYARPRAMHDAFEQFAAFPTDAKDNLAFAAAGHVESVSIPNADHWLMEEQPDVTIRPIVDFLKRTAGKGAPLIAPIDCAR